MNNTLSTEERIWAVLSHLSAITLGIGILMPVIGWSEQRRKSNFASFQSLQALGYQSLGYTIWFLFSGIVAIIFAIIILPTINAARELSAAGIWVGAYGLLIFGLFGGYFLLPITAAISCALGKDFRYPIMGNRLARYLGYGTITHAEEQNWLVEEHEDHWVAAMGHFSVIVLLWGMLIPLMVWILQSKCSAFLKFQSVQTLIYQGGTLLLYFGAGFVYLFGFLVFVATAGINGNVDMNSSMGFGLVVFAISMLITFVIVLIVPLLHILGQWAGYRVLKGDDYCYPIIGRLVEDRVMKR